MQEQNFKLKYLNGAVIILLIYDMIAVNFSYLAGLWLRFDLQFSHIESRYITAWAKFIPTKIQGKCSKSDDSGCRQCRKITSS